MKVRRVLGTLKHRARLALAELPVRGSRVADLEASVQQLSDALLLEGLGLPIPPKELQVRVVGGYSADFIASGPRTLKVFDDVLAQGDLCLGDFGSIYDFGCGCGRVARAVRAAYRDVRLVGTDIDASAIAWLREHCAPVADFRVNQAMPPTDLEDDSFDFVYSISIFTHLPEDMQFAWLEEVRRVLAPGAYFLTTTHGEKHWRKLPADERRAVEKDGFFYRGSSRVMTEGLPAFYQVAYHDHGYIHREWSRFFDVVDIRPLGLDDHQDIVLLRKPG